MFACPNEMCMCEIVYHEVYFICVHLLVVFNEVSYTVGVKGEIKQRHLTHLQRRRK